MRRSIAVLLCAAPLVAFAALTAGGSAQAAPPRSLPDESHAVVSVTDIATDAGSRARGSRMFTGLQELRRAEDRFHARNGRYTADRRELAQAGGYQRGPGEDVFVTAGQDWVVIRGEIRGVSIQQLTVWRAGGQPVQSGAM